MSTTQLDKAKILLGLHQGPGILVLPNAWDAELEAIGVRRVSIGGGPSRAALGLARRIAMELRDMGTYTLLSEHAIQYAELNQLLTRSTKAPEREIG